MRVFITPCETHEAAWTDQCDSLHKLAAGADARRHEVVDDPEIADIVLITDLRKAHHFESLRHNPILEQWIDKAFVYTIDDRPIPFVRGVYTSTPRTVFDLGRLRAGFYVSIAQ